MSRTQAPKNFRLEPPLAGAVYYIPRPVYFTSFHSRASTNILRQLNSNVRYVKSHCNAAMYIERLAKLNQWSLEERRNRSDLIEVFKMAKNLSPIPLTKFFELNTDNRTRGHSLKLVKHRCNCEVRRHFSERVVSR